MDTRNYRDKLKDQVLEQVDRIDLSSPNWKDEISKWLDSSTKTDIIWFLKELVEKGKSIDKSLAIAEMYSEDPNPDIKYDNLNEKISKGEEIRYIYTVRATVSWLLQSLVGTLKTEYYPRILDITEKLCKDDVYYVRQQATVPLSSFAINIRAKQNSDGTIFDFKDEDRGRVVKIAFDMLHANRNFPRVLEHLANVFDKLRFITKEQAKEALQIFCYDKDGQINPEYLTSHVVPLVIFFAEFRKKFDPSFDNKWFQDFLVKFIKDAKDNRLRSSLIWHTWRIIEEDKSNYEIIKQYIKLFLINSEDHEPIGQMEFLVNAVLKTSPDDGAKLYLEFLKYLNNKLQISSEIKIWFTQTEEIVMKINETNQPNLIDILTELKELRSKGCYIGNEKVIFSNTLDDQ